MRDEIIYALITIITTAIVWSSNMVKDIIKTMKHAVSNLFIGIGNDFLVLFVSDCVIVVGKYNGKITELFSFPVPDEILKYFGKADFRFEDGYLRSRTNKIEGKIVSKENFEKFANKIDDYFSAKAVWNNRVTKEDFLGRTSIFKLTNVRFVRGSLDDSGKFAPVGEDIKDSAELYDARYLKSIWRELCENEPYVDFEYIGDQLRAKIGDYFIIVGKKKV